MRLPFGIDRQFGALRLVLAEPGGGGIGRRLRRAGRRRRRTRSGHHRLDRHGQGRAAPADHRHRARPRPWPRRSSRPPSWPCSISTIRTCSLIPKDTKGTAEGARLAAESALQDGAELIIGPLFAQEVSGAGAGRPSRRRADDRFLQRREGCRRRRLSAELPGRARRAAHRLVRRCRAASAISPS